MRWPGLVAWWEICIQNSVEKLERRILLSDVGVCRKIILKGASRILNVVVWTGLTCLSDGFCEDDGGT
jgi:hypothetical protein